MIQPFTSNHGQQNVAGVIFVDDSNRPLLLMIAVRYARQWFRPVGLRLSQDNDFCGSANAKFESRINLRVCRLGENAGVSQSLGLGRGGSSHSDP